MAYALKCPHLANSAFLNKKPYEVKVSKLSCRSFISYGFVGQNSLYDDKFAHLGVIPSFSSYLRMTYVLKCHNFANDAFLTKNHTK